MIRHLRGLGMRLAKLWLDISSVHESTQNQTVLRPRICLSYQVLWLTRHRRSNASPAYIRGSVTSLSYLKKIKRNQERVGYKYAVRCALRP